MKKKSLSVSFCFNEHVSIAGAFAENFSRIWIQCCFILFSSVSGSGDFYLEREKLCVPI